MAFSCVTTYTGYLTLGTSESILTAASSRSAGDYGRTSKMARITMRFMVET